MDPRVYFTGGMRHTFASIYRSYARTRNDCIKCTRHAQNNCLTDGSSMSLVALQHCAQGVHANVRANHTIPMHAHIRHPENTRKIPALQLDCEIRSRDLQAACARRPCRFVPRVRHRAALLLALTGLCIFFSSRKMDRKLKKWNRTK
jgi:hypothetical protein